MALFELNLWKMALSLRDRSQIRVLLGSGGPGGLVRHGFVPADPCVEVLPRRYRLARPDPESRSDADNECHEVFHHEYAKYGLRVLVGVGLTRWQHRARDAVQTDLALSLLPSEHPGRQEDKLIAVASDDCDCRYEVQHGEDANTYHEFFQFVCLGPVVLHDGPDVEQRSDAHEQEDCAEDQVDEERSQHKALHHVQLEDSDAADAAQHVTFHLLQRQNGCK